MPPTSTTAPNHAIESWAPTVTDEDLADLGRRLAATRWPAPAPHTGSDQGPPELQLRRLVDRWSGGYDWSACAAVLDRAGQFRTTIDGVDIWFLHVRSSHPGALPLLLCHGWPGSVLEFRHLLDALTEPTPTGAGPVQAFDLVIPAMPGFAFSGTPSGTGWGVQRIARAWVQLMDRLGHQRWGMHGGDWGSAVVEAISRLEPAGCVGMHVTMPLVFPTADEIAAADDDERAMIDDAARYQRAGSGYAAVMGTRPQTIGYALDDSPAGLAAWIYDLFLQVGDHDGDPTSSVALDDIIDDVMLYWLPRAGASSAPLYWEAQREQPRFATAEDPNPMPAGFSVFPREAVRVSQRWIEARYPHTVFYRRAEHGGHFAALEQSAPLAADIRATFTAIVGGDPERGTARQG